MTDPTESVDKNLRGFSISDKVEELKKKLHLKSLWCWFQRQWGRCVYVGGRLTAAAESCGQKLFIILISKHSFGVFSFDHRSYLRIT